MLAILTSHPIQYQAPLWRELASAGVDVEVWFLTPHAVERSFDREFGQTFKWDLDLLAGYRHRFLPIAPGWRMNEFNGVRLQGKWRDEFAARGVTHLWVEGWRFREFWAAIRAAHSMGVEVWLRGETNDLVPRGGWRDALRRVALRWLFARVDRFLCIGSANRRFYLSFGVPSERLASAPYCVENARFASAAVELRVRRDDLRARWSIFPDAFVLLFCGKLIAKKHPLDLVLAAATLQAEATAVHVLFAGDGELAGAVRAAATTRGLPYTITGFLNQSEIPSAYAVADCLVLPSDSWETWGLVVNEALASGLDIVVSDQAGCAEDLARPLGTNHVFRGGDVAALTRALAHVRGQASARNERERIIDAHAPARTVATVRALLASSSVR